MSVIQELGATLNGVSAGLPLSELRLAADRVQAATGLLGYVLHTSGRSIGLSQLAAATTHLEQAFATLARAQETLAEYQLAIGLGVAGATPAAPLPARPEEQDRPKPKVEPKQAPALDDWWETRVDVVTGLDDPVDKKQDEKPPPAAELLRRVATLVRREEPKPLRVQLWKAGPAIGLRLTALCAPLIQELSGELLGRKPGPADVPELRERLDKLTVKALPGLPPQLPDILLGRACHAEPTHGNHGVPEHPVDSATGSAVLVGALLATLRRPPESLSLPETEEK
ncbi:hypothetical protein Lfu02_52540 [Longispora fulva]|uniref:Uncharacterized protein n=1 Tax=Longispora fulva TaxID=619741 RepID=A0A8J7GHP8_9ACTN|nr:hypothetical protein [Longispora fulva]MBG6140853.1 hypothetical protein [Longispora fulva]GIG60882.1 hypothetical protein Lfu02_52540 [Longispora fulva]